MKNTSALLAVALSLISSSGFTAERSLCDQVVPEPATTQLEVVARCQKVLDPGMSPDREGAFYYIANMDSCLVKGTTALGDQYYVLMGKLDRVSSKGSENGATLQIRIRSWGETDRIYSGEAELTLLQSAIGTDEGNRFKRTIVFDREEKTLKFTEIARTWGYLTDPRWRTRTNVILQCE